jgi:hypothetical protein
VVAELARRDGIQVTLRTSAYGGVLAVVLVPERAVAAYNETPTMEITGEVMKRGAPPASAPPMAHPAPPVQRSAPRSAPPAPSATPVPVAAPAAPVAVQAPPAAPSRPRLPVRRPQEHLNPMLREDEPSGSFAPPTAPVRSPDQARDRFARYQHGWRAGRRAADPDQSPPPGN